MSLTDFALAPGLLLAAPRLDDPNFEQKVVLLGQHDEEGALGWVLNGGVLSPVGELLREAELVPAGVVLPRTAGYLEEARVGGPVAPGSAWLLFRAEEGTALPEESLALGGHNAITSSREVIESLARGRAPSRFRLLLGYAGWGPMQLEGEIQEGAWLPARVDLDLVFELDPDELWDAAYRLAVGAVPMAFGAAKKGSS